MDTWHDPILEKLKLCTGFETDVSDTHLAVRCQNPESFEVSIHNDDTGFQIGYDGWHEHFDAPDPALACFMFGLSRDCRLKVVKRGRTECSWTVQSRQDATWIDDTTTGLIFIPFWRSAQIEYRHNVLTQKTGA